MKDINGESIIQQNCDTCINGALVGNYPDKCPDCGRHEPEPEPRVEPDPSLERAFPLALESDKVRHWNEGMSLRDYFAANAMNNLCQPSIPALLLARYAYEVADAMMEARKEQKDEA